MGQAMVKVQSMCCSQNHNPSDQSNQNNNSDKPNQQKDIQQNQNQKQQQNQQQQNQKPQKTESNPKLDLSLHSESSLLETQKHSDLQCFLKLNQIGQGAFGKVYTVKKNNPMSNKIYAMKIIKKTDIKKYGLKGYIQVEKEVLQNNKQAFIVDLKYAFQTPGKVYLVMEFVQGGSLYPYLRAIPKLQREKIAQFVMAQTILGIETLHKELHVIYRDLKPENILVTQEGNIKLTDFGLSKVFNPEDYFEKFKGMGGTQEYFAPEVVQNQPWDRNVDIWSLGIFLYELIAGQCPFIPEKRGGLTPYFVKKITNVDIQFPSFFSSEAVDLIKKILQKNPTDRLGSNSFDDLKNHPFFKGIDWKNLAELKVESPLKKYVKQHLASKNTIINKLPPRPILETFIKDPQLQIQGLSYKPDLAD